jgi:anhydro-N-acetylmuramic acid kinase
MEKYKIIGNMTGNSMDAADFVLTEFSADSMQDICTYSASYSLPMQKRMSAMRELVFNKTADEIMQISGFKELHDDYIKHLAAAVNRMCLINGLDKSQINAIGFHGKTLDHNPPSKVKQTKQPAYTLQIGSGQMLADLTGIPVVYDFRSDFIAAGFDGAPLIIPHNARIAALEDDGCYYNGGNTANFAIVKNLQALFGSDSGPFNEYTDNYLRLYTDKSYDKDGIIGSSGKLLPNLLQYMFDCGRTFYETKLPKSGDPAYYQSSKIFAYTAENGLCLNDVIHTFEYFAAYIAVHALTLIPPSVCLPSEIILFGGGWKNPQVRQHFAELLRGKCYVLPEHTALFSDFLAQNKRFNIRYSALGEYMEARLMADLAYHKLQNAPWCLPETDAAGIKIVCGVIARPQANRTHYTDYINRAAKR